MLALSLSGAGVRPRSALRMSRNESRRPLRRACLILGFIIAALVGCSSAAADPIATLQRRRAHAGPAKLCFVAEGNELRNEQ